MENSARCLVAAGAEFAKNRSNYWALDLQSVAAPSEALCRRWGIGCGDGERQRDGPSSGGLD